MSGVIARFKGADLFLEAYRMRRQRGDQPPVSALLAGPLQDDIRPLLQADPYRGWVADGSIVVIDRYLSEYEMYAAAAAVDLVVAPYFKHQNRSSIILWAAAAGRPCIGPVEGLRRLCHSARGAGRQLPGREARNLGGCDFQFTASAMVGRRRLTSAHVCRVSSKGKLSGDLVESVARATWHH